VRQNPKALITLLLFIAIAGGLGLYAYRGVTQPEEAQTDRKQEPEKLFAPSTPAALVGDAGPAADVVFTQLTVQAKGATATLELQEDTWRLTSPVMAAADPWAVEGIISQLQAAKFKATAAEAPTDADLEKYGLKSPVFTVSARAYVPDASGGGKDDPARQQTVTLYGGIENPFDGSVYVRREGDPRVYSADGSVRYSLEKDLYALRDKELFGLDEALLKTVEVTAKAGAYTLERDTDKSWRLTKPTAQRADVDRVKKLLQALRGQRALSFPTDSPEARAKLGLDKPPVEALFTLTKGEPVRVRLSQVKSEGATKVYALREQGSEATLAEVPEATLRVLDVGRGELREKTALVFRVEEVKRLVIYPGSGAEPITLAHTRPGLDGWEVQAPRTGKAKAWKVASLLSSLQKLKAAAFGEANPKTWDKYGITDTSQSVSLQDASGQQLARLWIGGEVPGQEGLSYVRGSGAEVMEVELARLGELPSRPEELIEAPPSAITADAGTPDAKP
jgi:hypothetical protein